MAIRDGQSLTQELLNSLMREPGENPHASALVLPACPQCGERYCGNGAQLCTECAAPSPDIKFITKEISDDT